MRTAFRGAHPQEPNGHTVGTGLPDVAAPPAVGRWRGHVADDGAVPGAGVVRGMGLDPSARSPPVQECEGNAGKIRAAGGAGRDGANARPDGSGAERVASAGQPPQQPQNRPPGGRRTRAGPRLDLKLAYIIPDSDYVAKGQVVRTTGFDAYMRKRVGSKHRDDPGAKIIREMFGRVGASGFGDSVLDVLLSTSPSAKQPWRVGESLAECFLEDYEEALFPYPYSRAVKSERASHAGADLVGYSLGDSNGKAMFLFGETKTSNDAKRPPRVARSLGDQLDALCAPEAQKMLVKWLTFRAYAQDDQQLMALHLESMSSYRARKFRLVGVLIRGPGADQKDLKAAFDRVKMSRCAKRLDLISLYLPVQVDLLGGML